jgi:hypothetical protein
MTEITITNDDATISISEIVAEVWTEKGLAESALVTPYKCSTVTNKVLEFVGIEKVLPGPMFYTYTKKGYIKSTDGKVNLVQLTEWIEKYVRKNLQTTNEVAEDTNEVTESE